MTSTHLVHVENTTGRKKGCPNYKKDILLNVISDVLPAGQVGWTTVANRYMIATSENLLRDGVDIKRHFLTPWLITEPKGQDHAQDMLRHPQVCPWRPGTSSIGSWGVSRHLPHINAY